MAEDQSAGWTRLKPAAEAVAASASGGCWSVQRQPWASLRPDLPAEVTDLIAPAVVVGVLPALDVRQGSHRTPAGRR